MKKTFLTCITLMFVAIGFAQNPAMMKYIPENAAMVVNFNPLQLGAKVPAELFRQSALYDQIMKKGESGLKAFLSDPTVIGIDFASNIWVVTTKEGPEPGRPGISIFGVLKDERLFAKTIQQLSKGEQEIKRYGTDRVMLPAGAGPALAWNNEVFVITMAGKNKAPVLREDDDELVIDTVAAEPEDTFSLVDFEAQWMAEQEKKLKALRNYCFELLTPKKEHAITGSAIFRNAMMEPGDVRIWSVGVPKPPIKENNPMAKELSKLFKMGEKNMTSVINFENGQITAQSYNYPNPDALALYKKFPHPAAPVELLKQLPEKKKLAVIAGSFNTKLAQEIVKESGLQSIADSLRKAIPFIDKLPETFTGSIMVAVMKSEDPAAMNSKLKGIEVIIALPVSSKSAVDELKNSVKKLMESEGEKSKTSNMLKEFKSGIRYNDKILVIATTEAAAQAFLDNPATSDVPAWATGNYYPVLANIDLGAVLSTVLSKGGDSEKPRDMQMKKVIDLFERVTWSGGYFNNDRIEGKLVFGFTNKQDNAMVQVFNLINQFMSKGGRE